MEQELVACFGRCGLLVPVGDVTCGNPTCYQKMMNRMSDAVNSLVSTRYKAFAAHKSELINSYCEAAARRSRHV